MLRESPFQAQSWYHGPISREVRAQWVVAREGCDYQLGIARRVGCAANTTAQLSLGSAAPPQDAEAVLLKIPVTGRFLVRKSSKEQGCYVISLFNAGTVHHNKLYSSSKGWFAALTPGAMHESLQALLRAHVAPEGLQVGTYWAAPAPRRCS